MNLNLDDLIIAYRKAKVDAYYENGHIMARAFAQYEVDLESNLNHLLDRIQTNDLDWFSDENYTGEYQLVLKDFSDDFNRDKHIFFSDGTEKWNYVKNVYPEFRVIGVQSVDFHVICSLWIDKIGHILEKKLSNSAYGCRLKRTLNNNKEGITKVDGTDLNPYEHGHFRSYFHDYKQWQKNGFEAIKTAIGNGKKVVAITADVTRFYHSINPDFLFNQSFYDFIGINDFNLRDDNLTNLLVHSFHSWSNNAIAQLHRKYDENLLNQLISKAGCGVPIGISASKVVANLVLHYLDWQIEQELNPIYYGRYVDDIFLVIEDKGKFKSNEEFWIWLTTKIAGVTYDSQSDNYVLSVPYATNSDIQFNLGKQKIFVLSDTTGEAFVKALKDNLEGNSSEWRMLPDSDENLETLSDDLSLAHNNGGEKINNLRHMDEVSIQRLELALRLRNFESVVELLPNEIIEKPIADFFKLVHDFIIVPLKTDVYAKFYPRFLKLLIRAGNVKLAIATYEKINYCWRELSIKGNEYAEMIEDCRNYSNLLLQEAVITSVQVNTEYSNDLKILLNLLHIENAQANQEVKELIAADLHAIPLKAFLLNESKTFYQWAPDKAERFTHLQEGSYIERFMILDNLLWKAVGQRQNISITGLFFATRPFKIIELTEVFDDWMNERDSLDSINGYYALFYPGDATQLADYMPKAEPPKNGLVKITFGNCEESKNPVFALTSFFTHEKSWIANVADRRVEPDGKRYLRLFRLINEILLLKDVEINYVVFPELSIPRKVLTFIAQKLATKNISLISGVEYETISTDQNLPGDVKALVSNQLVYFLCSNINGRSVQFYLKQEKILPAFYEEVDLFRVGGKLLTAQNTNKYIINHNDFFFSGLICNDLLDIDYRQALRGDIDALIVVEWNKDVKTYDSLVQSTSYDLHCFIVQVNNRKYGDTRLRAPYKEEYERDKVRVRGGELDYFVVSTLDVKALREFQSVHRSDPNGPFKPVPTGYKINDERRTK